MGEKWEGEKESSSFPSSSGSAIPLSGSLISLFGLFHSSFLHRLFLQLGQKGEGGGFTLGGNYSDL